MADELWVDGVSLHKHPDGINVASVGRLDPPRSAIALWGVLANGAEIRVPLVRNVEVSAAMNAPTTVTFEVPADDAATRTLLEVAEHVRLDFAGRPFLLLRVTPEIFQVGDGWLSFAVTDEPPPNP